MAGHSFRIEVNPKLDPDTLYSFYGENHICEERYSKERATVVLDKSDLIVAAFAEDRLTGFLRALCDGRAAVIAEFCVAINYQGIGLRWNNGSVIEKDDHSVGREMARVALARLAEMGADFYEYAVVAPWEEPFFGSIGFKENDGHKVYYIDRRPYEIGARSTQSSPTSERGRPGAQ